VKTLYFVLPLLLVLVVGFSQVYGEELMIEFPDHAVFIKGEAVIIHAWGVDFDSQSQLTGIILDKTGTQIDSVEFDIERTTDVGDYGWTRIETDNANYQIGVLYTVIGDYQGQESELQFTLSEAPPTLEELTTMIQSQQSDNNLEFETLRTENAELKQEINKLNGIIENMQKQIDALIKEFTIFTINLTEWFEEQVKN